MSELYNQIEELMFELEDDENPVGGPTIAIVPGAFKPPHLGHLDMVRQYSQMADKVIILISSPLRNSRTIGTRSVTPERSMQIWEMFLDDAGLPNVGVMISETPSPIAATYEYIGSEGPLSPGTNVILGASRKGNDLRRWRSAEKYVKPGVNLLSPAETAVVPTNRPNGEPFSATDARKMLAHGENTDEFFGPGRDALVRSILGLDAVVGEMSAAGGGAITGAPVSPRTKKKTKHPPYNELYLYKEVLKLLTNEGVIK